MNRFGICDFKASHFGLSTHILTSEDLNVSEGNGLVVATVTPNVLEFATPEAIALCGHMGLLPVANNSVCVPYIAGHRKRIISCWYLLAIPDTLIVSLNGTSWLCLMLVRLNSIFEPSETPSRTYFFPAPSRLSPGQPEVSLPSQILSRIFTRLPLGPSPGWAEASPRGSLH